MATNDSPLSVAASRELVLDLIPVVPAGSYVIQGSGFGTKPATTPTFDDFETEPLGSVGGTIGNLTILSSSGTSIVGSGAHSGSRCLSHEYGTVSFPHLYRALSGGQPKGYMSQWVRWSGSNSSGTAWKFGRVGAGSVYSGNPKFSENYTGSSTVPQSFGGELVTSSGIVGYGGNATYLAPNPAPIYTANEWHFYELEWDAGTVDVDNSFFEVRCDNKIVCTFDDFEFLTSANSNLPDWVLTLINGLDQGPAITMLLDSVYVDESRARVVMTDNADYSESTQWAVQPIESYSDDEIVYIPKRQSFSVGATAYLHVFNDAGSAVVSGSSVTVGEDA